MTQRETIQLLMKALGETMPEHGCRHDYRIDWLRCNRCQALFAGQAVLDENFDDALQNAVQPARQYANVVDTRTYENAKCCEIGCPYDATFIECTLDSIFCYCEDHGMRRGLQRGILLDDKSKTYDDYRKSRNRVLGDKS